MKLILVLHTTTDWDLAGRIKGQRDIPLNSQGEAEAQKLGESLLNTGATLMVSSPLKRANATADIINLYLHIPIILDERIRECSFGRIEGLTKERALEEYGSSMEQNLEDQCVDYDFRAYGGENREAVFSRHMEVINSLSRTNPKDFIVLVGHERGLSTLLFGLGFASNLKRGEYKIIDF